MSFGRRNTDWQAWGQHRRRATARMAQKSREREIEEYQARFKRPAEKKEEKNDLVCCRIGGVGAAGDLA